MWVGLRYTLVERAIIIVQYCNIQKWYSFHLTQESCFSLFDKQSGTREEVICEGDPLDTQSASSLLSAHHQGREKDDPRSRVTIPYIQSVSEAVTRILSDIKAL